MMTWVSAAPTSRSMSCRMGVSSAEAESSRRERRGVLVWDAMFACLSIIL